MPESQVPEARPTADIIAFPHVARPQRTAEPTPPSETPADRLRGALALLEAAQAEQRTALTLWRDALTQLSTNAHGLHESLSAYQAQLGRIPRP